MLVGIKPIAVHMRARMEVYFLTRESLPEIQSGQRAVVVACLQPPGAKRTLDELVSECLKRDYPKYFKKIPKPEHLKMVTARSILYHLIEMESLIGIGETTS
jgi:hypothetical protein